MTASPLNLDSTKSLVILHYLMVKKTGLLSWIDDDYHTINVNNEATTEDDNEVMIVEDDTVVIKDVEVPCEPKD